MLKKSEIPLTESLKDALECLLPLWKGKIVPDLVDENKVFISAHGNTIHALVKHMESISDQDIENVEIPTGIPLVYQLDGKLRPLEYFYLSGQD